MVIIYIPCSNKKEAKSISKALLEKKLIACSNIFPIESMYWWEGKIQEDKETLILAKTKESNFKAIIEEVKKLHSYDLPAIIKLPTECNKEYDDWVDKVTT